MALSDGLLLVARMAEASESSFAIRPQIGGCISRIGFIGRFLDTPEISQTSQISLRFLGVIGVPFPNTDRG